MAAPETMKDKSSMSPEAPSISSDLGPASVAHDQPSGADDGDESKETKLLAGAVPTSGERSAAGKSNGSYSGNGNKRVFCEPHR